MIRRSFLASLASLLAAPLVKWLPGKEAGAFASAPAYTMRGANRVRLLAGTYSLPDTRNLIGFADDTIHLTWHGVDMGRVEKGESFTWGPEGLVVSLPKDA